jgi:YD repeat-containing protein
LRGESADTVNPASAYYTRRSWDPFQRIRTDEGSTTKTFDKVDTLKWKYEKDGRIVAYIGVEQPFQHDYRYDDHDNIVAFALSYPGVPDVNLPSPATTFEGASYANEYDATGKLLASTNTYFGGTGDPTPSVKLVYTEDASGRCIQVDTTDSKGTRKEVRTYDDAGRVAHIEITGTSASTTDNVYDEQGRLISTTHGGVNSFQYEMPRSSSKTTYTYLPDGSERVEDYDGFTDVLSDAYTVTTRSAACLAIDADIGAAKDSRCHVEQ